MMVIQGNEFTIRTIRTDEMDAVLALYRQCEDFLALTPQPVASMAIVEADLALSRENGGDFCGIYDAAGTLMGIIDWVSKDYNGDPHAAFIQLLMIGQPYRGGLGALVVQAVEAEIWRDPDIEAIMAAVMVNNALAIRFWERHGYAIVGGPEDEPDGTTVWHFCKFVVREKG